MSEPKGEAVTTHNLPHQPTPFVGRGEELASVTALLAQPNCRLLTLVGPGGIGKTRLALEVARRLTDRSPESAFPNGLYFVPLQSLESSDFIISAIADAVGFQFYSGSDPKQQLLDYLRQKSLLLLLDNFEHLLDGAELVSEMLAYAPGLSVLSTSREVLNLQEEWVYPAKGLRFPEAGARESLEEYGAVRLFVQCARRMRADFALEDELAGVIRICQLVEGMPLAIELASAWVRALSCAEIASEIERSLDILATSTRNVPERHRTMRAALEHSWTLLTDTEREAFTKLSVFGGGFRKEAAQAVAGATLPMLSGLVDKSLLRLNANGRYDLHELLRQYGEELLNATPDERDRTRDRHSVYYAEFLQRQWEHLIGQQQRAALDDIEDEIDNVRTAWGWAVEKRKSAEIQKAALTFGTFLQWHNRFREGLDLFGSAAKALRPATFDQEISIAYGLVLAAQALFYNIVAVGVKAKTLAEESVSIMRHFDDQEALLVALDALAGTTGILDQITEHKQAVQEGLIIARETGDLWRIASFLWTASWSVNKDHNYSDARVNLVQGLAIAEQSGDPTLVSNFCKRIGDMAWQLGDYSEAKQRYEQGLRIAQELGYSWGIAVGYQGLAGVATRQQDFAKARYYYRQELEIDLNVGSHRWQTDTILTITSLLVAQDEKEEAVELLALIRQHPAIMPDNLDKSEQRLAELQAELAPEVFAAAVARGRARNLETTIKELITTFSNDAEAADLPTNRLSLIENLSEREMQILGLIADGLSNQEIADRLFLARGTVKWYISEIYSKLGVRSRTQALARARALNLLDKD